MTVTAAETTTDGATTTTDGATTTTIDGATTSTEDASTLTTAIPRTASAQSSDDSTGPPLVEFSVGMSDEGKKLEKGAEKESAVLKGMEEDVDEVVGERDVVAHIEKKDGVEGKPDIERVGEKVGEWI